MILTSEQFHSRLQSQEEIQRLYSTLNPIFEEIEIILYIRDPLKMAVSSLSTTIKAGGIDSTLNTPSSQDLEGNHYKTINQWEKNFPEAKITVRRFEKSLSIDGDLYRISVLKFPLTFKKMTTHLSPQMQHFL